MKKILYTLLFVPLVLIGQITPDMFTQPPNTGANMIVGIDASVFDQFEGGMLGAFYDLDGDGILECVGLDLITPGFFGLHPWGNDSSTPEKDGLYSDDIPEFAILYMGEVIQVNEYPQFPGYVTNAFHIITDATFGPEPISFELSPGWNMVGFTGCEITPIEEAFQDALGNGASLEETFQIIKDVRGIFWHQELGENSSLTHLTPGEGYMMYVIGDATTVSFSRRILQ